MLPALMAATKVPNIVRVLGVDALNETASGVRIGRGSGSTDHRRPTGRDVHRDRKPLPTSDSRAL